MKYLITGTTSGIGKAIKQQLMTKIAIKEYDYLNLATKKAEVTTTNRNLGLTENYWDTVNNQDVFSITGILDNLPNSLITS